MRDVPTLYRWLGLQDLSEEVGVCNLEELIAASGEWRCRLLSFFSKPLLKIRYRVLGGDALLADGRLGDWVLENTGTPPNQYLRCVHEHLVDKLGKPVAAELSPCDDTVLADVLLRLGFKPAETATTSSATVDMRNAPWAAHLSECEREWLEATCTSPAGETLQITIQEKTWSVAKAPDIRNVSDVLLAQVTDGRAAHIDRWPVPLPLRDYDHNEMQLYVRRMFRAMACRLVQNGRLTPDFHRHFVMNLWEPQPGQPDHSLGQFAGATEFVSAVPPTDRVPACFHFGPPAYGALRTCVYLAFLDQASKALGQRITLHSFGQAAFTFRQPVVTVGPSATGDWLFSPSGPWQHDDTGVVPAFLFVGIKHKGKYREIVESKEGHRILTTLDDDIRSFVKTIWLTPSGDFAGFPWIADGVADSGPESFGFAAGSLISKLSSELADLDDCWSLLGGSDEDQKAFGDALDAFIRDCQKPAIEQSFRIAFYRLFLANAVWFRDERFAHRQVPIAVASSSKKAQGDRFLAAGTYLVTQRHRGVGDGIEQTFRDRLGHLNTAQIAADAARYLLASASLSTMRREADAHAAHSAEQKARRREESRRRSAAAAITTLGRTLADARRELLLLIGLAGDIFTLWIEDSEPQGPLYLLTHSPRGNAATHISTARAHIEAIFKNYPGHSAAKALNFQLDLALAASSDNDNFSRWKHTFVLSHRQWTGGDSLPAAVGLALSDATETVAAEDWSQDKALGYPSVPVVWIEALRSHREEPRSESVRRTLALASFVVDSGTNARAGFVSISFERDAPTEGLESRILRQFEDRQIRQWADITVRAYRNGTGTDAGDFPIEPWLNSKLQAAFTAQQGNGIAVVLAGVELPRLKPT